MNISQGPSSSSRGGAGDRARVPDEAALSDRVLDARLPEMAVDAECWSRPPRWAMRPSSCGASKARWISTKRPELTGTRAGQTLKDLARARPDSLGSRRLGAHARGRSQSTGGAAGRRQALHRSRGTAQCALRPCLPRQSSARRSTRGDVTLRIIDGLRTLGDHAKGSGVTVILESHGDFTDSPSLLDIFTGAAIRTSRCSGTRITRPCSARKRRPTTLQAPRLATCATRTSRIHARKAPAFATSSPAPARCR